MGEVQTFGSQYSMRIWLNPDKLTDYQLTVDDVTAALRAYNVEISAGQFGGAPAVPGQQLNAAIIRSSRQTRHALCSVRSMMPRAVF